MKTTKIFKSGNSFAVRLPKEFKFQSDTVQIFKYGNDIILREEPKNLKVAFDLLAQLSDALPKRRVDSAPQKRRKIL